MNDIFRYKSNGYREINVLDDGRGLTLQLHGLMLNGDREFAGGIVMPKAKALEFAAAINEHFADEQPPFTPVIGKRHVQRNGEVAGVLENDPKPAGDYVFVGETSDGDRCHYRRNGHLFTGDPDDLDLVAVYEEPEQTITITVPSGVTVNVKEGV